LRSAILLVIPFIPYLGHRNAISSLLTRVSKHSEYLCMRTKSIAPLLANACFFHATLILGLDVCEGQQSRDSDPPAQLPRKETGRLPKVPTVESMMRPDGSTERFLSRTPTESAYEKASAVATDRTRSDTETPWVGSRAGWTAPEFYTRPLYFEQVQLERYESSAPAWVRPTVSYSQFLTAIPLLPFKVFATRPRDRVYTVGHHKDAEQQVTRLSRLQSNAE
jgi:hypothetical protein